MTLTLPPRGFAAAWRDAWNSRDLDRILRHYAEDVVFRSRKAEALVGVPEIRGKPALAAYWGEALAGQPDLHFTLDRAYTAPGLIVITYRNQRGVHTAETLLFGDGDLVTFGAAAHAH